ncbi:TOMM precursor leader peptide-binding protein [Pedobacter sp. KBW06]|uniref:TOMM precursor leader peptide-binding protein n=1 Tax=Pedobacter sp. KBW06 TaxID=2153359 RepID=UPI000F5A023B|nr:TOMM precursor leader peptide-binding protein [Pedobacter sp. KBW06]
MTKTGAHVLSNKIELLESISYSMMYTLEARALATLYYPEFQFSDPYAVAIKNEVKAAIPIDRTDKDFIFSITERAKIFDQGTSAFLLQNPEAIVLSLGCGLCSRANRLQEIARGSKWINVDLKNVIEVRNVLYEEQANISNKACDDIENANWLDELWNPDALPVLLVMEGVSPYLTQEKLEKLLYNIGRKVRSQTAKVSILFDYCHPDYSYDGTIINNRSAKKVHFQAGFKNASAIAAVVPGIEIIGHYNTLAANSPAYASAEAEFKIENNGELPYEIVLLAFDRKEEERKKDLNYFGRPLFWNKRYARQAAGNGNYLFLAEADHFICTQQEYDTAVSFLLNGNKLCNGLQEEVFAVYCVNLFQDAGLLLDQEQEELVLIPDYASDPKEISVGQHKVLLLTEIPETSLLLEFVKEIQIAIPTLFVFTDDALDPRLNGLETEFLNGIAQWVLLKLSGEQWMLGPLFPASTSLKTCYNCLSLQLWRNQPVRKWAGKDKPGVVSVPVVFSIDRFLNQRTLLVDTLKGIMTEKLSVLTTIDALSAEIAVHPVNPQHYCSQRDELAENRQSAIVFSSRPKTKTNDGGYRTISPAQSIKNLESIISPVTGIVHPLNCLTGAEDALSVYSTVFFKVPQKQGLLKSEDFIQYSLGKGISKEQSKISALSEAIERYNAMYDGTEECVYGAGDQLDAKAFFPETLKRYSQDQLLRFAQNLNGRQAVKEMPVGTELHWTPAYSLLNREKAWFPFTFCYSNTPYPDETYVRFDSNGCAAGNTIEEAVLQGFLELIERDAVAVWWYNRVSRPAVSLTELNVDALGKIKNALDENWDYWILDLTHDFGIPVVVAVGKHKISKEFRLGFGAHPEISIAVTRALTELYQIIVINKQHKTAFKFSQIADEPFLYPATNISQKVFKDYPLEVRADIKEDVEYCAAQTAGLGFDVFVLNTTRPAALLHTVKVIIPGLIFIWPELGNRRLFDLPVQLCWQTEKLSESELNKQELFL